jgi:molybdenum cofactor cytidylyltransferase
VIAAVILAAGESSRMGRPKALLPDPEGRPFVARLVRTFVAAGVADVTVVTGSQHSAIESALAADAPSLAPSLVRNPDPGRGQLSSLWSWLDDCDRPDVEAILVTPVDIPLIEESTIRRVIAAWERTHAPVVRPTVGARHGHPVLFARAVFDDLRRAPLDGGARTVVQAHAKHVIDVDVDDSGCISDIDTPGEYEALMRKPRP